MPLHASLHLFVRRVLPAELTELIPLQPVGIILFVLVGRIVPLLAEGTGHVNYFTHLALPQPPDDGYINYARISVTTPEPTVLPPSRTAKRRPWSMAIGLINSAVTLTLSPGMTISTPGFNCTIPVTSVVRK